MRLVVRPGEAGSVGQVLALHGAGSALAEGRVFLGTKRVDDALLPVVEGDEIVVEAPREVRGGVHVVSEYRSLYAVFKPHGLPTEPDRSGTASALHSVAELLGVPPSVLHAATRLDAQVSGLVVVARGAEASRYCTELKATGALRRRYLAVASRAVEPAAGSWSTPIGSGRNGVPALGGPGARAALTRYETLSAARPLASAAAPALLRVEPVTGRTHQIRLHAAGAGAPLLGDVKHGGPRRVVLPDGRALIVDRVALHAAEVQLFAEGATVWTATAPFPDDLVTLWAALGGDAAAPSRESSG
jgi:23S rRNA pseudouridine955/2504/2580 synthase/23S rRNA pseudouridine1911/1915/1917 synthase